MRKQGYRPSHPNSASNAIVSAGGHHPLVENTPVLGRPSKAIDPPELILSALVSYLRHYSVQNRSTEAGRAPARSLKSAIHYLYHPGAGRPHRDRVGSTLITAPRKLFPSRHHCPEGNLIGAPRRTRTLDLPLRRRLLYPAELWAHSDRPQV